MRLFTKCVFAIVTQASNLGALSLYTKLGFVKDEKMSKYYLNNGDAYRLKLWIDKEAPNKSSKVEGLSDGGTASC